MFPCAFYVFTLSSITETKFNFSLGVNLMDLVEKVGSLFTAKTLGDMVNSEISHVLFPLSLPMHSSYKTAPSQAFFQTELIPDYTSLLEA